MGLRLKEPKPLKPLRPIRWKRKTTASESEFAVRKIWTSKAGLFQIIEATYKHPYTYPKRYLALWFNGTCFQMVSNGHKRRAWARKACEAWNRMLYAKGQQRYDELKKKYDNAVDRQAERDTAKLKEERAAAAKAKRKADKDAASNPVKAKPGRVRAAASVQQPKAKAPRKTKVTKNGHSAGPATGSDKPKRTKRK